jgi:hypothetical protein
MAGVTLSRSDIKIVLSYRQADVPGMAGRIYDWLTRHYGHDNVFANLDSIPPGSDFLHDWLTRQEVLDPLPLVVSQTIAPHDPLPTS